MSPLIYLSLSRLKNTIRDLFRKPARLIYVVFLVALFVLAIGGNQSWSSPELYRDPREMVAMATALFLFIFLYMVWNGFSKGGTIFSLSDVNLIFPSPSAGPAHCSMGCSGRLVPCFWWACFCFISMVGSTIFTISPWGPWW